MKKEAYTQEQDDFIRECARKQMRSSEIANALRDKFGISRSRFSIIGRCNRQGINLRSVTPKATAIVPQPASPPPQRYTPEQDAFIRAKALDGMSGGEIAIAFNQKFDANRSRNSILARCAALKVTTRGMNSGAKRELDRVRSAARAPGSPPPVFRAQADESAFGQGKEEGKPLLELRLGECRWPRGEDAAAMRFCAEPTGSGELSYCAHHFAMSVGRGTPAERGAIRAAQRAS